MKQFIIYLHQKALSHPTLVKASHTAWQSFLGVFLVGITGVFNTHSLSDAKTALIALLGAAVAAGLSAGKSVLWPTVINWAALADPHITEVK